MANIRGRLPMLVTVDEQPRETHATYSWNAGGKVLTISTVLPEQALALELISTYVGHPQTNTIATHLLLGPAGHSAEIHTSTHDQNHLDPSQLTRECAYDHAHELIEQLAAKGHQASVTLEEGSFTALEAIE